MYYMFLGFMREKQNQKLVKAVKTGFVQQLLQQGKRDHYRAKVNSKYKNKWGLTGKEQGQKILKVDMNMDSS